MSTRTWSTSHASLPASATRCAGPTSSTATAMGSGSRRRWSTRPVPHRMTGADWIWGLARLCELAGHPLYLLGSEPPLAREAAARLRLLYPRLDVVRGAHGFFEVGLPHHERVIEDISAHRPRIVLVGMGTPKQELWVDRYADRLDGAVVWTVGALFGYVFRPQPRAARWLG